MHDAVKEYSGEPECTSYYDRLKPFPFKKMKWSLDYIILADHKTLRTVKS